MILPEKLSASLNNRLKQIDEQNIHSAFMLRRFEDDALTLIDQEGSSIAHALLGAIYGHQGRVEEMREQFSIAIKDKQNEFYLYCLYMYGVSLERLGFLTESYENAAEYYGQSGNDLNALDSMIKSSMVTGRIPYAYELLKQWDKLSPNEPYYAEQQIVAGYQVIQEDQRLQDAIIEMVRVIESLLLKNGSRRVESAIRVSSDDESIWISQQINLCADVDEVVGLNFEIADAVAMEDWGSSLGGRYICQFHSSQALCPSSQ